jgi:1-acyl-sn-glycerol-3-phosphate acyltransferase
MAGDPVSRWLLRGVLLAFQRRVLSLEGTERIALERGPLIVAANHNQWTEAVLLPAVLAFLRHGHRVRFLADWNPALFPPVALIYRAGRVITLTRKPAKPAFLNVFKPLFVSKVSGFERARLALAEGESVGVFPEGTTNRHRDRLLKGYSGAAWLSLVTGVPVVPAGLVYPTVAAGGRVRERDPMAVRFGAPLLPGAPETEPSRERVREWHARLMEEIARLSGKSWQSAAQRIER